MKPKKPTLDDIFAEIGFPEPPKAMFVGRTRVKPLKQTPQFPIKECGKVTYPSERAAKDAIHNRLNKGTGGATKLIAYKCQRCGGFHMTSRPSSSRPMF